MKVLVSDNLSDAGVEIMRKAGLEVVVKTGMTPAELKKEIGKYDGLVIRSATKVTEDVVAAAKKLKVVGRAGSGLDNVDKAAASKRGIVVMNTPGGNTVTTAEHALTMMMSLARNIPQATASMKAGQWEKKKFGGVELYNKTLGIIGTGAIGSQLAKRAQGLGMQVLAYDPYLSKERAEALGVEVTSLDILFRRSDFISVHTPLTDETRHMINAASIKKMKSTVRIINCARGGIIDEEALIDALKTGKVAGAALDVFEKEPPGKHPLMELDNFICTPHLGASTTEAQENVAVAVAEQIVDYLVYGNARNAVNIPSVPADELPKVQPYLGLAEKLGSFLAQVYEGGLNQLTVQYHGEVADRECAPITTAVIKGLLDPIMEEAVNFVSAPFIAKDRGIEVKEIKSTEAGDYQNLIKVIASSGKKTFSVAGTLFGKKDARIVQVDSFGLEVIPEGDMLFLQNNDKPGVIGNVGSLLGKNNINIARMQFGRQKRGGKAVSVISVDSVPDKKVMEALKKLPNVLSVKHIRI